MEQIVKVKAQFDNSMWMKEILREGSVGLWSGEVNLKTGEMKLYVDEEMRQLLGLKEEMAPLETFHYFMDRVVDGYQDIVLEYVNTIVSTGKLLEVHYKWNHPQFGEIFIRCSGKRYELTEDSAWLKGWHQDVTELEQLRLKEISREKQLVENVRQNNRYNRLFQSVLCGIVQYKLKPDGSVTFKNANQEAIRIFGYEEREFWEKDDWRLPELIAPEDRKRVLEGASSLLKVGDKSSYEYRLLQKDGKYCWIIGSAEIIRDIDDEILIQSVFLDIDSSKKAELENQKLSERLEAGNELMRLSLEHTSIYEFYYDVTAGRGYIPMRTKEALGCMGSYENMPENFARDFVDAASEGEYRGIFHAIHSGEKTATAKVCARDGRTWYRITLSTVRYDGNRQPVFAVGIMQDISREKAMETALLDSQNRDRLTGLYTKEAGLRLIQQHMQSKDPDEQCVIMILDMDDFKRVNEEEGTVFADAVLQEVADILRAKIRKDDILVRLGGDEFLVYLKNFRREDAVQTGPEIADMIQKMFEGHERKVRISASIGMCATCVVNEFAGLYRCAESTLLYVKEHKQGQAVCYLDSSNELGTMLTQLYPDKLLITDIDANSGYSEDDIISFALELLGKSKNLGDAISLLLARIGKLLKLERVSIYEIEQDYLSVSCTYQWVRSHPNLMLERSFYLTREQLQDMVDMYDEDGLTTEFTYKYREVKNSSLYAALWNNNMYAGALGLEAGSADYQWTDEHRKMVKELARLISSFLMKARADAVSQAKSDFLSRMSHEIRTPMNAITGMTTIAKMSLDDKEKVRDCLNNIESANRYLLQLINDILDMSRIEKGKMEINYQSADMEKMMSELETLFTPQARGKNIELIFRNSYAPNLPVMADVLRLNQIMMNIIGNAIKFTPEGGLIVVSLSALSENVDGVTLRFSVKDNGIGISEAQIGRIFKAFEQANKETSARYGGTGLGLSISSRLVQMMGGCLNVESKPGEGAEFYFSLDCEYGKGMASDENDSAAHTEKYDFNGRRILLAEDNEINAEIAMTILESYGFEMECAADGRLALKAYQSHPPYYYDCILMDIQMPVMDGLQATRLIRTSGQKDSRTIPIIAMSANAFDEDTTKSIESGMNGHLAKPIDVSKVLETLAGCLQIKK